MLTSITNNPYNSDCNFMYKTQTPIKIYIKKTHKHIIVLYYIILYYIMLYQLLLYYLLYFYSIYAYIFFQIKLYCL